MKAPHAHIDNTRGDRNRFGQDKSHLKTYRPSRKSIHNRAMFNITSQLIHKPEFEEVRVLKTKLKDIAAESQTVAIDNSEPKSFKMSKKINPYMFSFNFLEILTLQQILLEESG